MTNTRCPTTIGDEWLSPTSAAHATLLFADQVRTGVAAGNRPLPSPRQPKGCWGDGRKSAAPSGRASGGPFSAAPAERPDTAIARLDARIDNPTAQKTVRVHSEIISGGSTGVEGRPRILMKYVPFSLPPATAANYNERRHFPPEIAS